VTFKWSRGFYKIIFTGHVLLRLLLVNIFLFIIINYIINFFLFRKNYYDVLFWLLLLLLNLLLLLRRSIMLSICQVFFLWQQVLLNIFIFSYLIKNIVLLYLIQLLFVKSVMRPLSLSHQFLNIFYITIIKPILILHHLLLLLLHLLIIILISAIILKRCCKIFIFLNKISQ